MKTAKFHEALASAAKNRGERWKDDIGKVFYFDKLGILLSGAPDDAEDEYGVVTYDVMASDLTATWVCETEGKDGE